MNLAYDMERRAKESPDRIGVIFNDKTFTFLELDQMASRVGNFLKSIGAGKGVRLGVFLPSSPELLATLFGAWKVGAVAVPTNYLYKDTELKHALKSTEAKVVITDKAQSERIKALDKNLKVIIYDNNLFAGFPSECPSFNPADEDIGLMVFTGGTSGEARAAVITHNAQYATFSNLTAVSKGKPGPYPIAKPDTPPNIVAMPLFHLGGLSSMWFAFNVGRSIILMQKFDAEKMVQFVAKYRPNALALMPTMIQMLVNYPGEADLSSVKSLTSTGQELNLNLKMRFEQRYKVPIIQNYGSTEAGHVAGWTARDIREGRWKPGAVGRVYDNVQVLICDEEGQEVPRGENGQIWVKTKGAMQGYAGKDSVKEKVMNDDGLVTTSDLGYLDEDDCLFVVGRARDMIKCGGFQVLPGELEEVLREHPNVLDVAVVGVPDERLVEIPKAFVVLKTEVQDQDKLAQELIEFCRSKIAHYKAVRAISFIKELPKSDVGKVLKRVLQEVG